MSLPEESKNCIRISGWMAYNTSLQVLPRMVVKSKTSLSDQAYETSNLRIS